MPLLQNLAAHCEVTGECGRLSQRSLAERLKEKIKMLESHGLLNQFKMQNKKLGEREGRLTTQDS